MPRVYLGLGSNLFDPVAQIQRAIQALQQLPASQFLQRSRLYRNPPLGPVIQPDYVNAVVALATELEVLVLLDALQAIETRQGRQRQTERWGPRCIDLDILLFGENIIHHPRLSVPHPGLSLRNFVLYPLYDIAPELVVPGMGPLKELLQRCTAQALEPLDE
ncbi:MAG: 2-amino-4-hydroxy-6-hydroxymethyldihydropteridine diphosphokinase [Gammaproteobacteria bacterium]|nr:2-amino-4-hydroxy-6-hydroxymethyldihydropteridine diphosphokinase [Gammaproteobacteria bacterium]